MMIKRIIQFIQELDSSLTFILIINIIVPLLNEDNPIIQNQFIEILVKYVSSQYLITIGWLFESELHPPNRKIGLFLLMTGIIEGWRIKCFILFIYRSNKIGDNDPFLEPLYCIHSLLTFILYYLFFSLLKTFSSFQHSSELLQNIFLSFKKSFKSSTIYLN